MAEDKKDIRDSGFTKHQTEYALKKAKMGYHLSYKENNPQGKKYYAWTLYKLHRELGLPLVPLPEVRMLVIQCLTPIRKAIPPITSSKPIGRALLLVIQPY
jgi:hypothetical protein